MSYAHRHSLHILMTFGLALAQAPPTASKTYVLDFVATPTVVTGDAGQRRAALVSRSFPTSWTAEAEVIPFELTLVGLDRRAYSIGEPFVYDIVLKHAFPWSRNTSVFNRESPVTRRASILLTIKDDVLGSQLLGNENVTYGSESQPDSLLVLRPADVVKIRARGQWYLQAGMPAPPPDGWVRTVAVRAQLQVDGVDGVFPIVESSKGIGIQLQQQR